MTITLVGTMTIKPEHEEEFLAYATSTVETVLQKEPGTILYTLHSHPTTAHAYVWVERYRDANALEAHAEAPYIREAMGKLQKWLAEPPELLQLRQIVPA